MKPRGLPTTSGGSTVIVWGLLAAYPFGGMTWQVLHYLEGLRRAGFDVWYVEDHDTPMLHPSNLDRTTQLEDNVAFLQQQLERFGFGERWVVRPSSHDDLTYGALDASGLQRLYCEADAALNLCGALRLRTEHRVCRRLVYVETDPVANQVWIANGDTALMAELDLYDYHFTYGVNLLDGQSSIPLERYQWKPTWPPVVPDWWAPAPPLGPQAAVTTVANWNTVGHDVVWRGARWSWNKRDNFVRFIDAPSLLEHPLEVATVNLGEDADLLREKGWRWVSASSLSDPAAYRNYIRASYAEFSVAKEQYVGPRSGWFSDRSVCYLAAGRPVLVQDTGFLHDPSARGILTFRDEADLANRAEELERNYEAHAAAAIEWAHDVFDAQRVMGEMMDEIGLS